MLHALYQEHHFRNFYDEPEDPACGFTSLVTISAEEALFDLGPVNLTPCALVFAAGSYAAGNGEGGDEEGHHCPHPGGLYSSPSRRAGGSGHVQPKAGLQLGDAPYSSRIS